MKSLSRRALLRWGAVAGAGVVLAACQPKVVEKIVKETVVVKVKEEVKVKETVIVAGTPQTVEKTVEKVITATPKPQLKAEIDVWTYPTLENDLAQIYDPLNVKFNELFPGIKVRVDVQTWSARREKLYTAAAGGQGPDIWWATTDTLPAYVSKGVALPLNDYIGQDILKEYTKGQLDASMFEGKLYYVMNSTEGMGWVYNGEMMKAVGADPAKIQTWDDIYALAEKAKGKGWYVEELNTASWAAFDWIVHEAGGTVYTADRKATNMTKTPCIEALKRYVLEYKNGWVPLEGAVGADAPATTTNYFLEKKMIGVNDRAQGCVAAKQKDPNFQYVLGSARHKTADLPWITGNIVGQAWAIWSGSKKKEAALEWVKWMVKPEIIGLFCTLSARLPVGVTAPKYWKGDTCVQDFANKNLQYMYGDQDGITLWQESKVTCAPNFQAAVLGKMTVEQALDNCDKALTELLKKQ